MTRYFLGVDTGSTKSQALIADEYGQALGFGQGGTGNPMATGYKSFAGLLESIVQEALVTAGLNITQISGAGFGIGGYDWPSQDIVISQAIESLGLKSPVAFVNDALIGLLAGAANGWGVAVVAGTSCNAWGIDLAGRIGRMTGFAWLGEAAGAQELVAKAFQAIAHEWTRRGPATQLTPAFVALAGVPDIDTLLDHLTLEKLTIGAEAAPVVFQVAADGDAVAQELIVWAGKELGSMANGIIRQLDLESAEFEVVLAGSFFKGSPVLLETMGETIHPVAPGAKLVQLHAPPVVGGVVLGMQQAGVNPSSAREQLIASTNKLLNR
jgi:N-acetylglucosamine kinase-like BadF-type ATPase